MHKQENYKIIDTYVHFCLVWCLETGETLIKLSLQLKNRHKYLDLKMLVILFFFKQAEKYFFSVIKSDNDNVFVSVEIILI